jgi:choline dehydrogenase-like flavoprotein
MELQQDSINIDAKATRQKNSYDAIVIGSGISGGWAAKELCELGLKTLVLERGRDVVHNKDYPTATKDVWQLPLSHSNERCVATSTSWKNDKTIY